MVDFHKSKKFFTESWALGLESFEESFKMEELKCQAMDHFLGIKDDFLDEEEELDKEPTKATTEAPWVEPIVVSEPIPTNRLAISNPALADPIIELGPSSFRKTTISPEDAPATADPSEKVGS